MTTLGLVGGLGPESTIDYYRRILASWQRGEPGTSPSIVIDSLDVQHALRLVEHDRPALVAYLLAVVFVRRLTKSSDGVPLSALGLTGVTRSTVSASGGEVSLDGPGEIERRLAWSDAPIAEGARVRVVEHVGTRVKVVAD